MLFPLLQLLRHTPIAFVDCETTGASAEFGHRVTELGIVRVEGGQMVAEYQQLVDPGRRVPQAITVLTGISQAMVDGQPTFADQLPGAMKLLRGAAVVGHNVRFDLGFISREFRRAGKDLSQELGDVPVFDTVRIARKRFGRGGNGLQRLAPNLGIEPTGAHRALADAVTTARVFERLLAPFGGYNLSLVDTMQRQGGPMGLAPAKASEPLLPLELEEALDHKKPVVMEYLDAGQRRTHRVIRPLNVRRFNDELILVAFCELRAAQRTFKVERIVQLKRVEDVPPEERVACE